MRTIKFRGKAGNGKWIYGDIVHYEFAGTRSMAIMPENEDCDRVLNYKVDPDTVGQFTGLIDKNGKEIYEGDVLKIFYNGKSKLFGIVVYGGTRFYIDDATEGYKAPMSDMFEKYEFEVINNIYDSSKLNV